jgi:serine/threonine protein kinase
LALFPSPFFLSAVSRLFIHFLTRLLGQGGFAEVYLAEHIHLRSLGAVKLLYGKITPQDVQTFINEARTIASLAHSHILRVLEFGFEQTLPFLVMEYAPGGTLRDHYPSGSLVPLPIVLSFVKQVASALAYAHNKKLIHRDVKPGNMLIDATNHILLSDFGIVAVAHSTASMKTIDSTGTVHYMAPEHIKGKPLPASDQYALGVVVYEWLCGERPFQGDTAIEVAMRQLSDNPPPLCQRVPSLSSAVEQVVLKALAKDPKLRFPDIAAFSSALE